MKIIKCQQAEELLSPFIDGAISPEDELLLQKHLSSCSRCAAEYDAYKKISAALKQMPRVTCRDPNFSKNIINSIAGIPPRNKIIHRLSAWKKSLAAAAAAALIITGSLSLANHMPEWQIADQGTNDSSGPETRPSVVTDDQESSNSDNLTAEPEVDKPTEETANPPVEEQGGKKNSPSAPTTPDSNNNSINPSNAPNAPEDQASTENPLKVLLSNKKVIESTSLKLEVENAEQVQAKIKSLVANANGRSQQVSQNTDHGIIIELKLSVDKTKARRVETEIAGLATTVVERKEKEPRDITDRYNLFAARYNQMLDDPGDQSAMENKASIKQQLDEWNWEAEHHIIEVQLIQK